MSGIWAEVRPVETTEHVTLLDRRCPEYGPKSGPLRPCAPLRRVQSRCPEYGPKSGPLRPVMLRSGWCVYGSGIWAEVRPVETFTLAWCRGPVHASGIWAEVRPVETRARTAGAAVVGPEYGPKSGPLRLRLATKKLSRPLSGIWAEVRPVEASVRRSCSTRGCVRNMGRSQAR